MNATAANGSVVPTLGFVPPTFPRDPIEVNEFYEHLLLGQILQPLVEADQLGRTMPGVASNWEFTDDGKTLQLQLKNGLKFSNGATLTSADVKATLERHLNSGSQSKNFLRGIKLIKAPKLDKVIIHMEDRNMGVLKALSRDQLGIQPAGWTFDPNSSEPFVGTGAFRLIREGADWFLKANAKSTSASKASFPNWKLIYFKNAKYDLPTNTFPDYVPYASKTIRDALENNLKFPKAEFDMHEQLSFSQTSIWWNPHGTHFNSELHRDLVMATVNELVEMAVLKRQGKRATGIIPAGIAGHLAEPTKLNALPVDARLPGERPQKIRFGARAGIFNFIFESDEAKSLLRKRNIDPEIVNIAPAAMKSLRDEKFDVVMGGWAGGFNDPDGFVPVVTQLLDADFINYLGKLGSLYKQARHEPDWTKRSELFQKLNEKLVASRMMVPGWKIPLFTIKRSKLVEDESGFRYTPRLDSIQAKKQ